MTFSSVFCSCFFLGGGGGGKGEEWSGGKIRKL